MRENASLTWEAQSIFNWDFLSQGIDAKHADCDGNGLIDINIDTTAISLNYGKTHDLHQAQINTLAIPPLQLNPEPMNVTFNEFNEPVFCLNINLSASYIPDNIYGMSFSVPYMQSGIRAVAKGDNSSLGTLDDDLYLFQKDFPGERIDIAIVRTDGIGLNATGTLMQIDFILEDNIASGDPFEFLLFEHIITIDNEGNNLPINNANVNFFSTEGNNLSDNNLLLVVSNTDATCIQNGTATAFVFGGQAPYTFMWENGQSENVIYDLSSGNYHLTVVDDAGFSIHGIATIAGTSVIETEIITIADDGTNNGTATVNAEGGIGTLQMQWSTEPEIFGSSVENLAAGIYQVSITDQTGCLYIETVEVLSSVLPLDWLKFEAKPKNQSIELKWQIAEESQIKSYDIQRSEDGQHFYTLGEQSPITNHSSIKNYLWEDREVQFNQLYYYRIKIIETTGKTAYSEIRTAQLTAFPQNNNIFFMSPNPAKDKTTIQTTLDIEETLSVKIFSTTGQLIQTREFEPQKSLELDISSLPEGLYLVEILGKTDKRSLKLIKH